MRIVAGLLRMLPLLASGVALPLYAAGTPAGTTISNTATATYNDAGGNSVAIPSNPVNIRVDEVLDVTIASADPGDIPVQPGATGRVLSFDVTNTGNGPEAFRLNPVTAIGGDAFDPTATSVVLDDGDGVYEPGIDPIYTPGGNEPLLAPDASIRVFVLSSIPGSATDAQRGQLDLIGTAVTGSGAPGTIFAGQGTGGGDAVAGASRGEGRDDGFYIVSAASVSLAKTASVLDPFGGTRAVPGAIITYTLVASVTGSGSLASLAVGDPVPAATSYVPASLTAQGTSLTDAADADAGEFGAGNVLVRFGTVAAGQTRTATFKVKVN